MSYYEINTMYSIDKINLAKAMAEDMLTEMIDFCKKKELDAYITDSLAEAPLQNMTSSEYLAHCLLCSPVFYSENSQHLELLIEDITK